MIENIARKIYLYFQYIKIMIFFLTMILFITRCLWKTIFGNKTHINKISNRKRVDSLVSHKNSLLSSRYFYYLSVSSTKTSTQYKRSKNDTRKRFEWFKETLQFRKCIRVYWEKSKSKRALMFGHFVRNRVIHSPFNHFPENDGLKKNQLK